MPERLFIGGSLDGMTYDVIEGTIDFLVPVPKPFDFNSVFTSPIALGCEVQRYEKRRIVIYNTVFKTVKAVVFVLSGMSYLEVADAYARIKSAEADKPLAPDPLEVAELLEKAAEMLELGEWVQGAFQKTVTVNRMEKEQ